MWIRLMLQLKVLMPSIMFVVSQQVYCINNHQQACRHCRLLAEVDSLCCFCLYVTSLLGAQQLLMQTHYCTDVLWQADLIADYWLRNIRPENTDVIVHDTTLYWMQMPRKAGCWVGVGRAMSNRMQRFTLTPVPSMSPELHLVTCALYVSRHSPPGEGVDAVQWSVMYLNAHVRLQLRKPRVHMSSYQWHLSPSKLLFCIWVGHEMAS